MKAPPTSAFYWLSGALAGSAITSRELLPALGGLGVAMMMLSIAWQQSRADKAEAEHKLKLAVSDAENIAYGRCHKMLKEIEEAAKDNLRKKLETKP